MAKSQLRSKRKSTGGKYKNCMKKKLYELGSVPTLTKLGERKIKSVRVKGANVKYLLLSESFANVTHKGKTSKAKIKSVVENPANRDYIRRNILTKGTIIETEIGKARITSRPGQEGSVNALLIK